MKCLLLIVLCVSRLVVFSETPGSTPIDSPFVNNLSFAQRQHAKNIDIYIPPAVFIGYGFLSLKSNAIKNVDYSVYRDMREDHPTFSTHIDNYLQYAPAVAAGLLSLSGVKGSHSFLNQALLLSATAGVVSTSVTFFKRKTGRLRPNQSTYTSFPSGHTSVAFATAEFLNQEYGDRSIWFGIAGYTAATATGILRVYNNAHWFSDVVAGAGFGILSTKAVYLLSPEVKKLLNGHQPLHFTALPLYGKGYTGLSIHATF